MSEHQPTVDGLNPAAAAYTGTELISKKSFLFRNFSRCKQWLDLSPQTNVHKLTVKPTALLQLSSTYLDHISLLMLQVGDYYVSL